MSENKKYYWLKLKENFFDEDTIAWIEEQENGKDYCLFYLKLCLKALRNEGMLIRVVGDILVPYDANKLAEITKTDIDTVIAAMELFKKIGLVQILENGEIYLTQLNELVGSETNKAELMRIKRTKDKLEGNNVTHMLPKRYPEIEIEKDIYSPSENGQDTKKNKEQQLLEDFEKIWQIYPRKEGKSKAFAKYKIWLKGKKVLNETIKLTNKQIWFAVKKYADESKEKEKTFIKMGSTFFADAILDYVEDLNG